MTDWLTVNAALRPDYFRNKESPMFLRKISLKIARRLAIKIRLVTYFLPPALERIKNTYCMGQRPFLYLYSTMKTEDTEALGKQS